MEAAMAKGNGKSRKKQRDIEEAIDEAETKTAGINSGLSDAERQALTFQHKGHYEKALAEKKAADAKFKNVCKTAKAECGETAIEDIKLAIALDTPQGEAEFKAEIERRHRVARWMGLAVGSEPSFFDENDATPGEDRAYAEGSRAGMRGDTANPPHDPSVPQYKTWMQGWHDGQAALASGIQKLTVEPEKGPGELPPAGDTPKQTTAAA
jgi:hypothetical protein